MFNLVMPYYENPGMLGLHLDTWAGYPERIRHQFRFVVVDDASPRDPAGSAVNRLLAAPDFELQLYRVEVDRPWAWDAARNIAMHEIPAEWALITDIDHLLTAENAEKLLARNYNRSKYYVPARRRAVDGQPYKPHPNSYVIHRDMYWAAGGYDETFVGYYGKDAAWKRQLRNVGKRVDLPDVELLLYGREVIPDASTTTYSRKEGRYYTCNNPAIRAALNRVHLDGVKATLTMPYHRVI
jgi:hypothetical protein